MIFIGRTRLDPLSEKLLLRLTKTPVRIDRWHDFVGVGRMNPMNQRTLGWISWDNGPGFNGNLTNIQSKVRFALIPILTMTIKTVLG
jgi:hypothetical protein